MQLFGKTRDTLWTLVAAPTIWAAHFLVSYFVAAFRCAPNADIFKSIYGVRMTIGVVTGAAILVIALICRRAWREWRLGGGGTGHDQDTDSEREHFLEFATLLLAGLSLVGVVFDVLPVLVFEDCR